MNRFLRFYRRHWLLATFGLSVAFSGAIGVGFRPPQTTLRLREQQTLKSPPEAFVTVVPEEELPPSPLPRDVLNFTIEPPEILHSSPLPLLEAPVPLPPRQIEPEPSPLLPLPEISPEAEPEIRETPAPPPTAPAPVIEKERVVEAPPAPPIRVTPEPPPEEALEDTFPPFVRSLHPVAKAPNWGAMETPTEWNRRYEELAEDDFVAIPRYDLSILQTPMESLLHPRQISPITAKLYYSTRFFGKFDLDSGEFEWIHPGIDIKLPRGTPVGVIGGGKVHAVRNEGTLGLHVIVEHRIDSETLYSIYGHLETVSVSEGQNLRSGQMIGTVGITGVTMSPHLHLQVDRGEPNESNHTIYFPDHTPSQAEADQFTVHPITFLAQYAKRGED